MPFGFPPESMFTFTQIPIHHTQPVTARTDIHPIRRENVL
jgi:hypothetical protein